MRHLPVFITVLLFAACDRQGTLPQAGDSSGRPVSGGFVLPPASTASTSSDDPESVPTADRRIARTGEVHCRVEDLREARAFVMARVAAASGYVALEHHDDGGAAWTLSMRVRVPAERFDGVVAALHGLGSVTFEHLEAEDVTAQWVDVEARLVAKQTMEKRFLELVARAATVAEVLAVERELGVVRSEIESMTARRQALGEQVAMSALTIVCAAPRPTGAFDGNPFAAAWTGGWNGTKRCLVALVYAWPVLLVGAGFAAWRLVRRRLVPAA
jgi:hypothetical protein